MSIPLVVLLGVLCLLLASWAGWYTVRDRPVVARQLLAAAVVELVLLVQAAIAGTRWSGVAAHVSPGLFWTYVAVQLFVLPLAATWAFAERTRWSSVVLLAAAVTVGVMEWRQWQIWSVA
ncbi:hypothetical protein [Cellulomonas sp. SG140]|uniref:hypothetical protein n=1 Tax=Cellulomonas sp. SG140 TaxID=2976536 RepID=UPI0021E9AC6E|nr:hypothetical protein [Cellulomonas sp. SG140]